MFCVKCGSQIPDGSTFCPSCGASQTAGGAVTGRESPGTAQQATPPPAPPAKRRNWFRRHPILTTIGGLILAFIILGIAVGGGSGSSSTGGKKSLPSATVNGPPPGAPNQVKSIVEDGGTFTYRKSDCTGKTCIVQVKQGETTFGSEHEVIEPMFPVFKGLFDVKHYKAVKIVAFGPVTSIGGKTSTAKTASVLCTQAANKQIDWDNIDMNGIHALCNEQQFVNFSK